MKITADNDKLIPEMLNNSKSIAVIGLKDGIYEVSYRVTVYMQQQGYKIYPVNPSYTGMEILGRTVYNSVKEIDEPIDMVNIFRRPDFLVDHAEEILQMNPLPKFVWFQLGIYNDEAAKMLEEKDIKVIQNRCIMVEHTNM